MPSLSSGPGGVQGPVNPDSPKDVQEKQDVTGKHGHRKVEETTPQKRILVKPRSSPRKKLSEFNSVKKVEPEKTPQTEKKPEVKTTPVPSEPPQSPPAAQGNSSQQVMEFVKQSKAWKRLEAQVVQPDGQINQEGLTKLIAQMPEMDFSNSRTMSLMSLFAVEQFNAGKFTEEQMDEFMDVYMDCYVKAKADEQVQYAVKMLPVTPKKSKQHTAPGRTAILAEIAAMTREKAGNQDAMQTARSALKTDMRADMYDQENEFLKTLCKKLEERVGEIDQHVAQGMQSAIKTVLAVESGSKKLKLSKKRQQKLVADTDLMVKQFVESQLREKKQKIGNRLGAGQPIQPIIDQILQKANTRREGLIAELTNTAGAELQKAFAKHSIPETDDPETVVKHWLENNGAVKQVEAPAPAAKQPDFDTPVHELNAWVDELIKLVPRDQQPEIDGEFKDQLRHELDIVAQTLDIKDGLLATPGEPSPFSRDDPLRKAMRRGSPAPDPFKPVKRTVTESLETAVNKELAKRAAQRAETELQKSREKPKPLPEKKIPPEVAPKPARNKTVETTTQSKFRELEGDGLVPTLVRQFERTIRNEKARADGIRPVPDDLRRPKG